MCKSPGEAGSPEGAKGSIHLFLCWSLCNIYEWNGQDSILWNMFTALCVTEMTLKESLLERMIMCTYLYLCITSVLHCMFQTRSLFEEEVLWSSGKTCQPLNQGNLLFNCCIEKHQLASKLGCLPKQPAAACLKLELFKLWVGFAHVGQPCAPTWLAGHPKDSG